MIASLAVHIDCFACASRFLSVILACSRPYLRRQLSGHTIDTMLFACPFWMHLPSLYIEGHVPTSYCITTDLSTLLTPWHRKIPCAWVQYETGGGEGYCNTLSLEGTVPKVSQIPAMIYTKNHHTNLIQFHTMFCAENCVLLSFQSFLCARQPGVKNALFFQGLLGKIQGLFKGLMLFQDYSRPVHTMN